VSGHGDDPEDRSEFRRALHGVRRRDRDEQRREPPPRVPPRPAPRPPEPRDAQPATFEIQRTGERVEGWASGVDRRTRKRLRSGEIAVEREIDLHGLRAADAERLLARELAAALERGERCVLVIHGRGLRSPGEPVLRSSLPDWLARPPHGAGVLAFTSASPGRGGAGATCVLLRRKR
jgi:DNA-nicking Smr family endonuclease